MRRSELYHWSFDKGISFLVSRPSLWRIALLIAEQ